MIKKTLFVLSFLSLLFVGQGYAQRSSQDIQNTMDGLGSGAEDENARSFLEGEKKAAQAQESADKQYTTDQLNTLYSGAGGAEDQNAINYYEDQYEEQTGEEFSSPEKDTYTQEHGDGSLPENESEDEDNKEETPPEEKSEEDAAQESEDPAQSEENSKGSYTLDTALGEAFTGFQKNEQDQDNLSTKVTYPLHLVGAGDNAISGDASDLTKFLQNIMAGFTGLVVTIAIFFIVFNAFTLITAAGDSDKISGAKKAITWTAVGIVVIMVSYVLVKTVIFLAYTGA